MSSPQNSSMMKQGLINDPIHGLIEIPEVCLRIIDTPQYQRLRHIKQLGAAYYVYPGAAHNRFEHGIGVCHLAGTFVKQLKKNDPENKHNITDRDIYCVQIAGLCHDLGHGPFSHVFERHFIHDVLGTPKEGEEKWSHEKASLELFDYLLRNNDTAKKAFDQAGLNDQDKAFIKRLISKKEFEREKIKLAKRNAESDDKSKLKDEDNVNIAMETGRGAEKEFLYEIVANGENGIDVDKFDYFARDCYYLGYKNSFQHDRLMKFARVIEVPEDGMKKHICFPDKEVENVYDLFYQRTLLHHRTCQHKTIKVIELMHMEALRKVNASLKIKGKDGDGWKTISDTIECMGAYTNLTDSVFERILRPHDEKFRDDKCLLEAYQLLERVDRRDHYKFVGEAMAKQKRHENGCYKPVEEFEETMKRENDLARDIAESDDKSTLKDGDIVVNVVNFNYGAKPKYDNPIDHVYFYNKGDVAKPKKLRKDQVSYMLPSVFFEQHVRVYSKEQTNIESVKMAFRNWCHKKDLIIIKDFVDEAK